MFYYRSDRMSECAGSFQKPGSNWSRISGFLGRKRTEAPTTQLSKINGVNGRLKTHTLTDFNVTSLGYNPASQIVSRSVTDNAMQTLLPGSSPASYVPNDLNQYTSVDNGNPLNYDDNGNLTAFDGWSYGYDAHNRLVSASQPAGTLLDLDYGLLGRDPHE